MINEIKTTGMTIFTNGRGASGKTKAIANVAVNNDYQILGLFLIEGANGLYVRMPVQCVNGEYNDVVYPITAQAREVITDCVIQTYNSLLSAEETKLPYRTLPQTESKTSGIRVILNPNNSGSKIKATGKAVLDNQIVISGIKVFDYTDNSGMEAKFITMPSILGKNGNYYNPVNLSGNDFRSRFEQAVLEAYEQMKSTEFRGIPYDELRKTGELSRITLLGKPFLQKLSAELEEIGIPYCAVLDNNPRIFVRKADEPMFDAVREGLTKKLAQVS